MSAAATATEAAIHHAREALMLHALRSMYPVIKKVIEGLAQAKVND